MNETPGPADPSPEEVEADMRRCAELIASTDKLLERAAELIKGLPPQRQQWSPQQYAAAVILALLFAGLLLGLVIFACV